MRQTSKKLARPLIPWHLPAIILMCIVVYGNSLYGAFVWDDEIQVVKNPTIRSLANLPAAFTQPFWAFASGGETNHTNFFRPMQAAFYSLAYWWGGLSPTPYHFITIAFHVLACVFLYLVCIELAFSAELSLLAAALFAVHPMHTEAVAWIAAMPDVVCGAFFLGSLWAFLKSQKTDHAIWLFPSAGLFFLALLSKEMAITLPLMLSLWLLSSRQARRVLDLWPFGLAALLYLLMRVHALGLLATEHLAVQASLLDWVTLSIRVLGQYLWYAFIPYPLLAYHLIPTHLSDRIGSTAGALTIVLVSIALVWKTRKDKPSAWFWGVSYVLLLIPVFYFKGISLTFLAERYLYIPSFAAILFVVTVISKFDSKRSLVAGWAVVGLFSVLTIARNQDWNGSERLYSKTLAAEPEVAHFQINLADVLMKRGDDAGSFQHLNYALKSFDSDKYVQLPFDHYRAEVGVGALYARAKDYGEARKHLEKALEINPSGDWAYLYLGGIIMQADSDFPKAIEYFKKAISLGPLNEVARDYLGIAFLNQGNYREAVPYFEDALRINPLYADAQAHLAIAERAMATGPR